MFDPLQRLARLFGPRPHELVVGVLQWSLLLALRICGTLFAVECSPALRRFTPYLVVGHHQSKFDVPIVGALLFSNFPKFVAKRELARFIPSISYNLRRGGNALIDRGDRGQATQAIADLGRRAERRGVSVVIYPEGTRARGGELKAFRPAGTLALLGAAPQLQVVPQYRAADYHAQLQENGIECSMSRKGECLDNAPMESFFHTLKTERTHHHRYRTSDEARRSVFEYIETFYNPKRRHSYLNYLSPLEFERVNRVS